MATQTANGTKGPDEFYALGGTFAAVFLFAWLFRALSRPNSRCRRMVARLFPRFGRVLDRVAAFSFSNNPAPMHPDTQLPGSQPGVGNRSASSASRFRAGPAFDSLNEGAPTAPWRSFTSVRRAEIERVAPEFVYGSESARKKRYHPNEAAAFSASGKEEEKAERAPNKGGEPFKKNESGNRRNPRNLNDTTDPYSVANEERAVDDEVHDRYSAVETESKSNALCVICIDELEEGDTARRLPCGHIYHGGCVLAWLSKHNVCPLCMRKVVFEKESSYEQQPALHSSAHSRSRNSVGHTVLQM